MVIGNYSVPGYIEEPVSQLTQPLLSAELAVRENRVLEVTHTQYPEFGHYAVRRKHSQCYGVITDVRSSPPHGLQ